MESLPEKIFADACELEADEREGYLCRACGSDAELRLEVQQMLVDADRARFVLGEAGGEDPLEDSHFPGSGHEAQGSQIGPYRLREVVGEGGFGIVWKAEQDHPIKRVIALKVLRTGLGTRQVLARFEAERQALALMDHPNIAKVFDAGSTDDGRPFFVMEFIRGETLTTFRDTKKLGTDEKLHLFLDLCDAIQHAHQKGVIHRDIKPGNVLVTEREGQAELKVIDFGIAKAVDIQLTERTLMTGSAQLMGTLHYMSPEQFETSGGGIDVRTDVYSMGVLLFELLTGELPHEFGDKPLHETARMVVNDPASRLSSTNNRLRGDLDTIVDKALQKEPARRYDSVSALAADIRRYLNREPIAARPTTTVYQLRLFARRNKVLVGGVLAVLLTLAAGMIFSLIGFSKARHEREVAETQAYRAALAAAVLSYQNGDMLEGRAHLDKVSDNKRDWIWQLLAARVEDPILTFSGRGIAFTDAGLIRTATRQGVEEWNVKDGSRRLLARFDEDDPDVSPLFSTDGELLIIGSEVVDKRRTFRVLDAESGKELSRFSGNFDCKLLARTMMAVGKDRIAYKDDLRVLVRDLRTGELLCDVGIPQTLVHAISPDGKLVAVSNAERGLFLIDAETGKPCQDFRSKAYRVWQATFSPDSKRLVSSEKKDSNSGARHLLELLEWDVTSGDLIHKRNFLVAGYNGKTSRIEYHPDGKRVAIGAGQKLLILDLANQGTVRVLGGLPEICRRFAFSPDGSTVAALDRSGLDVKPIGVSRKEKTVRELYYKDESSGLAWPSDDPNCLRGHHSHVYPVGFSPDGKRIASGGWDGALGKPGSIRIWDAASGQQVAAWGEAGWRIVSLTFSPDGSSLLASGHFGDGQPGLRIWDAASGRLLKKMNGNFDESSFGPDGKTVAVVQGDRAERRVSLIKLDTMEMVDGPAYQSHGVVKPSPAFSPDGERVASVLPDPTVVIWDVATRRRIVECKGHEAEVSTLAFDREGERLVTASLDDTVRVWNARTGENIATFRGPHSDAMCALFAPDGEHVISGSRDGKIRFWRLGETEAIAELSGHLDYVFSLSISPDGKTIASGSGDHTIRLWGPDPAADRRRAARLRSELAERLTPAVRSLHEELASPHAVISQLNANFRGRELEVALQLNLAESLQREALVNRDQGGAVLSK